MNCFVITLAALLLAGLAPARQTNRVLRTTAEVRALNVDEMREARQVELSGQIAAIFFPGGLLIVDETGGYVLEDVPEPRPKIGDLVSVRGRTYIDEDNLQDSIRSCTVTVLGHRPPPVPRTTDASNLSSGRENFNLVKIRGFVTEVVPDEINVQWNWMVVRDHGRPVYISVPEIGKTSLPLPDLVDAEVEIVGIGVPHYGAERMFIGPHLETWSKSCIKVLIPPQDPFSAQYLSDIYHVEPEEIFKIHRRRITGLVLAAWHGNRFLVREESGRLIEVELSAGQKTPRAGEQIEAVGFPGTDLFRINLSRALVRELEKTSSVTQDTPHDVTPRDILLATNGTRRLQQSFHGKAIRLTGVVRNLPSPGNADGRMNLDCDGYLVPIDLSTSPGAEDGLSIGCKIEATGICVMETEKWSPSNLFPVFGGFMLVLRSPADIRVLSRPSWWTPARLLIVICSLFAALIVFFIWNRFLHHIIEKRGRQLFKEQIARAGESLKVGERTRLAVELHDSLSQNLAGLACQITAAKSAIPPDAGTALHHLETAERMLLSSRTELRRCLWDLRGDTLEMDSMTEAIKKTILPVIGDAKLFLRFNIPRPRLLDSTAHSILCIIRELAANAIRHGQATQIRIAGEFHDDRLSFSVRDNGCGFDTTNCAGLAEGHFGLEGIKERVERLDGSFEISSAASAGTRAEIALPIPRNGKQPGIES